MSLEKQDRSHWSAYWLSTRSLNSFDGGSQAGQYDGPVRQFWQEQFSLCGMQSLLLDVGTGNGALAFLAAEYFKASSTSASIVAIDAADIAPLHAVADDLRLIELSRGIQFLPRTKVEKIPLDDGVVDLAMSQFGFEYAQREEALDEVFRVLKPDGRCVFIVHDRRSAIILDSLAGLDVLTQSLEKSPLFPAAKEFLTAMAGRSNDEVDGFDRQFRRIAQELMARFSSHESRAWFSPILKSIVDTFTLAMAGDHQLAISVFEKIYDVQMAALLRLREQVLVAFDEDKSEELMRYCSLKSIKLEMKTFSFGGQMFGRVVYMRKSNS